MVAEVVGGLWTGSLALLADAGHMLVDVAAVGLALGAMWISRQPPTTRHTYAFARAEILAALINGLALWVVVAWIGIEAVQRFRDPTPVAAGTMMVIALGGLIVNSIAFGVLHGVGDRERSLNLHGALLHVVGDLLGSAGVVLAGIIIWATGWVQADPVVSLVIGGLILFSSWRLVREAVHILLEGVPRGLDVEQLLSSLRTLDGVTSVHDLHVWTITSGYPALSAHVVCAHNVDREMVLAHVNRMLRERYKIFHTTIQLEPESPPDHAQPMKHPLATVE
jgi:cobalt-zinc-cadmium efflux system protein